MNNLIKYLLIGSTLVGCTKESFLDTDTTLVNQHYNNDTYLLESLDDVNRIYEHYKTFTFTTRGNFGTGTLVNTSTIVDDNIITFSPDNIIVDTTFSYTIPTGDFIDVFCFNLSCFVELDVTIDNGDTFTLVDDDQDGIVTYFYQN